MRRREVRITAPFKESFAEMAGHYKALRPLFPDAGARLSAFADRLFERVIPMLETNAEIGRPYLLVKLGTQVEATLLAEMGPILASPTTMVREWVERDFTILYLTTPDHVYLVDLKHHRQLGY